MRDPDRAKPLRRPLGRLTAEAVRAIRESTESNTVLAQRYGVDLRTIRDARQGLSWRHVAVPPQEPRGSAKGEANGSAKLTAEAVREIRGSSESLRRLAKRYDVGTTAIHNIRKGLRWGHLEEA